MLTVPTFTGGKTGAGCDYLNVRSLLGLQAGLQ